jgi:lysophospholipase L1-like esterase
MKRKLLVLSFIICHLSVCVAQSVSILGDSYSTYEGFVTPSTNELWYYAKSKPERTDVSDVRQTWWHQVISENGWRLCQNNSYSGATISYTGYSGNDYSKRSFLTRMTNLGCPDVIFIFGATNDSWANAPIGEYQYENLAKSNLWTFRPAMAKMLEWMTKRYVGTEIYFLLNDGLKAEINESVKTICSHYGVKCIELTGIDKMSGHPSVKGMKQIADQVAQALR